MKRVYKFDLFDTYTVDPRVLIERGTPNTYVGHSFISEYSSRRDCLIVPVPKLVEVTPREDYLCGGKIDIRPFLNTITDLTFEDKVYIHPNCDISRAKVTQKYTRVIKPERADICVVPKLERELNTEDCAIFINRNQSKIYILQNKIDWINGKPKMFSTEKCADYALGSRVLDINSSLKGTIIKDTSWSGINKSTFSMTNWEDFLDSILLYYGPVLTLYSKEHWIADVLYNKLHDIITVDKLLSTLGDSTNEFTQETYDNLKEMLNSSDSTVVGLGLKALAEMDYSKYRNTTIHLLCNCDNKWRRNQMKFNSSVKYMLNYLDLWRYPREIYTDSITKEDFDLLQEVVNYNFQEEIESLKLKFNSQFPFAKVDLSYQFAISPKLGKVDDLLETEDSEDIDLDGDFDENV